MDKIPQGTGRPRQLTVRLASEEEAIVTASQLAMRFRETALPRDGNWRVDRDELDVLSQSGLLAITVPPDYGGIDISNCVLAKIAAIVSEADARIGRIMKSHFYTLEALRTDGTDEQKRFFFARALASDSFACVPPHCDTETVRHGNPRVKRDGLGYRISESRRYIADAAFADWIAVVALNDEDRLTMSLMQLGCEATGNVAGTSVGTAVRDNIYIHADAVIAHHKGFERPTTIDALGRILDAGVDLGIARKSFAKVIEIIKMRSRSPIYSGLREPAGDARSITRIGELAVRLEAATALIESAGLKVDVAQIETTQENVTTATLAAGAAKVLTSEIARDASEALRDILEAPSADGSLDRLWRETSSLAQQDPAHREYLAALGNYHLNGVTIPSVVFTLAGSPLLHGEANR